MKQDLINRMKVEPFNTMLDACSNAGLYKTFPVTVHLFDINFNRVMNRFFDMYHQRNSNLIVLIHCLKNLNLVEIMPQVSV